ncbi:MAG: nicotinate-nicotinamide nucleotide adenylyltransferase [Oligoflexia bacterium]|nr:nicotinate-nicotinamide nucleotide adenylyltransferase [Oligoflexia bacterium]
MRVAVYGGSFNPPHVGHAMVVAWLLWTRRVDAVWIVPVYRHAFEGQHDKSLAPFDRRLAWCRAMAAELVLPGDDRIAVLDIEAHLPVPSFTIDTLRHLQGAHPGVELVLVVGADVVPQLPRWHDWAALRQEFPPLIVGRPGFPVPDQAVVFPDLSSSDIRARLRSGQPVGHLLPAGVADLVGPGEAQAWWGPG